MVTPQMILLVKTEAKRHQESQHYPYSLSLWFPSCPVKFLLGLPFVVDVFIETFLILADLAKLNYSWALALLIFSLDDLSASL